MLIKRIALLFVAAANHLLAVEVRTQAAREDRLYTRCEDLELEEQVALRRVEEAYKRQRSLTRTARKAATQRTDHAILCREKLAELLG